MSIGHPLLPDKVRLTIAQVEMKVRLASGEEVEEDINCDSSYMLDIMPKVGQAIRDAFHWIPATQTIYLIMDNAGGHGTVEAIRNYVGDLWTVYKIEVIHQIPRSPETNVLNLGIWCTLQWAVDRAMFGVHGDVAQLFDTSDLLGTWQRQHG